MVGHLLKTKMQRLQVVWRGLRVKEVEIELGISVIIQTSKLVPSIQSEMLKKDLPKLQRLVKASEEKVRMAISIDTPDILETDICINLMRIKMTSMIIDTFMAQTTTNTITDVR